MNENKVNNRPKGRPKVENKYTFGATVSLNEHQRDLLTELAHAEGMNFSAFVRQLIRSGLSNTNKEALEKWDSTRQSHQL